MEAKRIDEHNPRAPLRMLTWNVHSCRSAEMRPSLDDVAEVIRSSGAAIVALQEVDVGCPRTEAVDQPRELAQRLGMTAHFCPLVDWQEFPHFPESRGQYGLAFLCQSECDVAHVDHWSLPTLNPLSEPRGVFQLTVNWEGTPVVILNTHLSVQRRERMLQLDALSQRIGSLHAAGSTLAVLGDFNTIRASLPLSAVKELVRECLPARPPRATFPSRFPVLRLDRVFLSQNLNCTRVQVIRSPLARRASDHLPVYTEVLK